MPHVSGRQCVLYQAGPGALRLTRNGWTIAGKQVTHPKFIKCEGCPHWLGDEDYWTVKRFIERIGKQGLVAA